MVYHKDPFLNRYLFILFYFSTAFDSINRVMLFTKLMECGIIIIFIRINNYTYRVHIKHLSTNYIKIFRIENKLYYNNYFLQNHSNTIQHLI